MGTRSRIAIQKTPESPIRSISCHWDGYLSHVGKVLNELYNSEQLAEKLIEEGNLSSLGYGKPNERYKTMTDIRRPWEPIEHLNEESLRKTARNEWSEYIYIFRNNRWEVLDICLTNKGNFEVLSEALEQGLTNVE